MDKEIQKHVRVDRQTGKVLAAENDFAGIAEELVAAARGQGIEPTGPNGLLAGLTRQVLQTALEVEMADHSKTLSVLFIPFREPTPVSAANTGRKWRQCRRVPLSLATLDR